MPRSVRHHPARLKRSPTRGDVSLVTPRGVSICCRRATPAARRGRTSRRGSRTPRPVTRSRRGASSTSNNPFPAIHGRVCYHPCESVCNRANLDSAVSIHSVERFLGESGSSVVAIRPTAVAHRKGCWSSAAGPSGLSAAYHLRRLGHEVEIRDAGAEPGGMIRYSIPADRLPRDVLDAEVGRIAAMGVRMVCNYRVEDLAVERSGAASTRSSSRSAPIWPSGSTSRPGTRDRSSSGAVPAQRGLRGATGDRAQGRGLRRRQHRLRRGPGGPPPRRRGDGRSSIAGPGPDAGARGRGAGRGTRGRSGQLAAHHHVRSTGRNYRSR